jgi:outer membrane protein OmpA-like peptidoglycan-associated protein
VKEPPGASALPAALANLPAAQLSTQPLRITYPQGSLFSQGAVLFYAGGPQALDPLAAVLLAHPQSRWQGTVTAQSPISPEHALALAQARARLLQRYLQRKGVTAERLALGAEAGDGADLQLGLLSPQADSAASSSLEKQ